MATEANLGLYATQNPAQIAFTDTLFTPKPFTDEKGKEKGDPKYSAVVIFPSDHADLSGMKAVAAKVARASWPDVDFKTISFPFKSGSENNKKRVAKGKKARDYMEGKVFITGRSMYQPRLSGIENGKMVDYDPDTVVKVKSKFYSGVEALVEFNFVANEVDEKKSVTAYLNMVFTTGKGTRLAGGRSAAEAFKGYVGHATTEDPTGGKDLDDEIPF